MGMYLEGVSTSQSKVG